MPAEALDTSTPKEPTRKVPTLLWVLLLLVFGGDLVFDLAWPREAGLTQQELQEVQRQTEQLKQLEKRIDELQRSLDQQKATQATPPPTPSKD